MSIKYRFATNLKDIETRKQHLPTRLKRICCPKWVQAAYQCKAQKEQSFSRMAIPLMQKKMFHGFNFFSRKKLVKLYVKLVFASPKFPNFLGSFFSASSQADFASFFLLSKESNETFTNASHHLLVCGIALCSRQLRFNASSRPVQSTLKMFSNSKQRSGKALQTIADKEEMKFEVH